MLRVCSANLIIVPYYVVIGGSYQILISSVPLDLSFSFEPDLLNVVLVIVQYRVKRFCAHVRGY